MNRQLCGYAILFAAASIAAASCTRSSASTIDAAAADVPTVAVAKVARGDVAQSLTVAAEFRPFQEIEVHAKVAGYLKSIRVDVGDRVNAGELLAVLEIPELEDQMRQDEATVKRAAEEVNRASADLTRAESAHDIAHLSSTRLAGVLKVRPNLVAQQDIDEAAGRDRMAEAQIATARAALAAANEQLEIARASQNKTKTLYGYSQITAPFAGVITHRYADTGAMIQAGTSSQTQAMPIVKLSQNSRLRLVIPVPESAAARIHVGTPVSLQVQALGRTLDRSVARVADRLDADTRTMQVEVDVDNADLRLMPGMYADATIVLDQAKHVVVSPVEAIDRGDRTARVLVVRADHKVERRDVRLGLETADRVQIASGLQPGDFVIVGNRAQLRPGMSVIPKIVEAQKGTD